MKRYLVLSLCITASLLACKQPARTVAVQDVTNWIRNPNLTVNTNEWKPDNITTFIQAPPPIPARPIADEVLHTIISNAVRSCAEEYTKTYVRAYVRAMAGELSNQINSVVRDIPIPPGRQALLIPLANHPLTNFVPTPPQPCEHAWVPLRRYQEEHFCSRCGVKEWK